MRHRELALKLGEGATTCFWLEPNGLYRVGLRRFTHSVDGDGVRAGYRECAEGGGCDGSFITEIELPVEYHKRDGSDMLTLAPVPDETIPPHTSSAWPDVCEACAQPFRDDDRWQAFEAIGYVRSDSGETIWVRHVHGRELAGALYDGPWLHEYERLWGGQKFVGADGIALIAVCPDGHPWQVDGEATGGGHWTRTGDPRKPQTLSVSPSIKVGDSYHGFLTNGVFTGHVG